MGSVPTFLILICITHLSAVNGEQIIRRDALEIIIGGGGGANPSPPPENQNCPPPPPTPCPPPPKPKPSPSPPPPKPSPPQPSPPKVRPRPPPKQTQPPPKPSSGFESERLALVYPIIQKFKLKVKNCDPKGISNTWTGKNICGDYKGFVCDTVPLYKERALAGVKFNNFNFGCQGRDLTIDEFLINLPDLVFFHANSNNFTGSIPSNLDQLKYFYELDLSNNKFSGNFPYQVLRGNKLLFLDLRFNTFAGIVPPEIFLLKLDLLFINNNNFVQKLPDNLGKTTAIYLTFANNEFVGPIPPSIGQASNTLQEVLFLNNKLTGCLPYEIGFLKKATVFDVGSNYLTGPIPHSFQCLRNMELLNLAHNKFSGVVPEAVCSLPKLSNFTLSYNYFTQVGPKCRELINKRVLNVNMNCIYDLPNQRSVAECSRFFSSTHDSCVNAKSLTYVPCLHGLSGADQLEAVDGQLNSVLVTAPVMTPTPAQAPRGYGALSPHY